MQTKIYSLLSITALSLSLLGSHAYAADAPGNTFFYDDVPLRGSQGFYIGSTAGLSIADDYDVTLSASGKGSVTLNDAISSNYGYHTTANLGYHLNEQFRIQADLGYLSHNIDSYNNGTDRAYGDYRMLYVLGLLAYDFPTSWSLKPYIGAGIGYGVVHGREPGNGKFSEETWVAKASAGVATPLPIILILLLIIVSYSLAMSPRLQVM